LQPRIELPISLSLRRHLRIALQYAVAAALVAASALAPALACPPLAEGRGTEELYRHIGRAEALRNGVPFALVDAVMSVESGYDPLARGGVGEIGLMQVMPATAALMGFEGSPAGLAEPATNIAYGTRYLAQAWRLAGGDICTTVMKYRAGHGEKRFSARSVSYCNRVRAHLERAAFPTGSEALKPPVRLAALSEETAPRARERSSRKADCFRRVVQPGRRFGACIPRSVLAKKGLLRSG
jgi:soluble lytic murein transglycosylase-like protein